jgi:hypothetical protein
VLCGLVGWLCLGGMGCGIEWGEGCDLVFFLFLFFEFRYFNKNV